MTPQKQEPHITHWCIPSVWVPARHRKEGESNTTKKNELKEERRSASKRKTWKYFQTGEDRQGTVTTQNNQLWSSCPSSRFPALNKETFVRCKPDHVIPPAQMGTCKWEALLQHFLNFYRKHLSLTAGRCEQPLLRVSRQTAQNRATTLSSHRLCLTLNILASLAFILQCIVSLFVVIQKCCL